MRDSKIICLLILVVIFLFVNCSCSSNNDYEYENPYSREAVEYFSSRSGFGKGRTDVDSVVLKYVYDNTELSEKYGNDFCVDGISGTDEGSTFFFSWLYNGTGDYFVEICGDTWTVKVSKSYFGNWEVTECYQEES